MSLLLEAKSGSYKRRHKRGAFGAQLLSNCAGDGKAETGAQEYAPRVRSRKGSDEQRRHFEVIVPEQGTASTITLQPHGSPAEEGLSSVTKPRCASHLLGTVRGLIENERRRLIEFQKGDGRRGQ
jgi:hypothetical protein